MDACLVEILWSSLSPLDFDGADSRGQETPQDAQHNVGELPSFDDGSAFVILRSETSASGTIERLARQLFCDTVALFDMRKTMHLRCRQLLVRAQRLTKRRHAAWSKFARGER